MRTRISLFSCVTVLCLLGSTLAQADTLLIDRVRTERGQNMPTRGMSMAQVEQRYGAPMSKLSPAGGDSQWHPTINRWVYANYIVYFERDHVIDAVMNHATANEIGPKNVPRSQ
jgi:hypothetical protein